MLEISKHIKIERSTGRATAMAMAMGIPPDMKITFSSLYGNRLFLVVASILFFKPPILDYYSPLARLNLLINLCRIALCLVVLFGNIMSSKLCIKKYSIFLPMFMFFLWLVIATYLGHENVQHVFLSALYAFSFSIFFSDGLKYNPRYIMTTLFQVLFVWNIINLILFVALPNGIVMSSYYSNKIHFLGTKNGFTGYLEPLLVLALIVRKHQYCSRITFSLGFFVGLITALVSDSSTGLISVAVLLIFVLFQERKNVDIKKYKRYMIALIAISIAVAFFRIQNYFSFIIEEFFGKSADLTNRTVIWDAAIKKILESPFIGSGLNQYTGSILIGRTYYYSHNMILELLVSSGIIGLLLYLNFILSAFKNYFRKRNGIGLESAYDINIAVGGLISFLITAITEAPIFKLYMFMCLVILDSTKTEEVEI